MRFATIIVTGLLAVVASAQSETTAAPPSATLDPAQQAQQACLNKCPAGDVNCQAHCITVPSPNDNQANATTQCVAKCPQGDGSPAQTQQYAQCIDKCIADHYYVSSEGTPQPTGGSGSGGNGGSGGSGGASPTASGGSGGSGSGSDGSTKTTGTKTGSTSTTTATHNAAPLVAGSAMLGLMGALFAL